MSWVLWWLWVARNTVLAFLVAGTAVGGKVLDMMSDVNFKRWTRWVVSAVGVFYLIQAAQLFLKA